MATTTTQTLLELIVVLVWACLSVPVHQNGLFKRLFFDKDAVAELCSAASLVFCSGLLEALQGIAPPSLSFFRNTSSNGRGRWGVYCLIMEKLGCISLVYIGSGTNAKGGLPSRWNQYKQLRNIVLWPKYVLAAYRDGYRIVHKGWLVSAPIPAAANVPAFRLLFVAIEATLSFYFWAMKSRVKDYKMDSCCPWPRTESTFTYHGLCGHNALLDGIVGNFDLSAEDLDAMEIANRDRIRRSAAKRRARLIAADPEGFLKQERERFVTYRTKHRQIFNARLRAFDAADPARAKARKARSKEKLSGRYRCEECQVNFAHESNFKNHVNSKAHKIRLAKVVHDVTFDYNCEPCDFRRDLKRAFTDHLASSDHKAVMANLVSTA